MVIKNPKFEFFIIKYLRFDSKKIYRKSHENYIYRLIFETLIQIKKLKYIFKIK
jgi:hypothetical protein